MRTVTVEWHPGEERFTAVGRNAGHTITINAPDVAGADRAPTGFSATELLLAGAGACAAWDVVAILHKGRQPIEGLDVRVTGEQAARPPYAYEAIDLHFTIRGDGLRRSAVERAVRLGCERYCSVLATVRGVARVVSTFEIVPAGGAGSGAATGAGSGAATETAAPTGRSSAS
jgi:putative redox protein